LPGRLPFPDQPDHRFLPADLKKDAEVNLGKTNEEITWKRNDEIGGLVKEYNKMVKKLEESAVALAKSEREGAWRKWPGRWPMRSRIRLRL